MTELLLSRSSDPVGLQVLIGIVSALLFYLLYYLISGRKHNDEVKSVLSKVSEKEDSESIISQETSTQKANSQEDVIRSFLRSKFDSAGKSILLTTQGESKRDQYVNNCMKLDNYYIHELAKEPGYDEIVKIANDNGIDLDKIKQDEFKRAIDKYTDPFDYL